MSALGAQSNYVVRGIDGVNRNAKDLSSEQLNALHTAGTITDADYQRALNPQAGDRKVDFGGIAGNLSSMLASSDLSVAGSNLGSVIGGLVGLFNKDAGSKLQEGISKVGRLMNDPYSKNLIGQAAGTGVNMLGNVVNAGIGIKDEMSRTPGDRSYMRAFGNVVSQSVQGGLDFLFNKKSTTAGFNQLIGSFK